MTQIISSIQLLIGRELFHQSSFQLLIGRELFHQSSFQFICILFINSDFTWQWILSSIQLPVHQYSLHASGYYLSKNWAIWKNAYKYLSTSKNKESIVFKYKSNKYWCPHTQHIWANIRKVATCCRVCFWTILF